MFPKRIRNRSDVKKGVDLLIEREPLFQSVVENAGYPPTRLRKGGFATLAFAIIGQQVSRSSADAIWNRFCGVVDPALPETYLALTREQIDQIGLSEAKRTYLAALSEAIVSKQIVFSSLHRAADEDAIDRLVSIKGVGRWTAEIYLLSAMGRSDAWPAGDLALQVAAQEIFDLPDRPSEKELREMGVSWKPLRSIAARLLWHDYAMRRNRKV